MKYFMVLVAFIIIGMWYFNENYTVLRNLRYADGMGNCVAKKIAILKK